MNPGQWTTRDNDCSGISITSPSHDNLLSRSNVAPVNFIADGQVHRHLNTTNLSEIV